MVENPNEYEIYDKEGNPISALVENSGSIIADGGQVVMTAAAARGVVDSVINMDGVVQANSVGTRNGKIVLGGGTSGVVKVSGEVAARGDDAGEAGGHITITGELLYANEWADIDASGMLGGGTILFGGDYLAVTPQTRKLLSMASRWKREMCKLHAWPFSRTGRAWLQMPSPRVMAVKL